MRIEKMKRLGEQFTQLTIAGARDAAPPSGDGAIGGPFHGQWSNFTAIHHAVPVSCVVMSQTRDDALPDELRVQLDKAARSPIGGVS
jgi:TRAP-type C4-dicarboxylate transport system substrate-binding protein